MDKNQRQKEAAAIRLAFNLLVVLLLGLALLIANDNGLLR